MKLDSPTGAQGSILVNDRPDQPPPALLYEMMRSFVTLADKLNLSAAVKELGSTRQTVRRHIMLLEEEMGDALFSIDDRRYSLTDFGANALPEAIELVARGALWLRGTSRHEQGLQRISFGLPNGWTFEQQQQPLSQVWNGSSLLMRETLRAWTMSGGRIESAELAHVRPYLIVYRLETTGWLSVEFGDESFYVKWFGWAAARSGIGRNVGKLPGGPEFAQLLEQPYAEVTNTQGVRLDHVYTQVPKGDQGTVTPVGYARLMMGGRFPDQSQALFALVEPTADLVIEGLDSALIPAVDEDITVKFDKSLAKFEQN